MADNEPVISAGKLYSPYYYDQQLLSRLTAVSLHPNRVLGENGKWEVPNEPLDDENYTQRAICKSVLSEDYQVAVSNSWSQFGDDEVGSMFNQLKPFAPYASHLANVAGDMLEKMGEMKISKDEAVNSSFFNVMQSVVTGVRDAADKGSKILNKSLVAQGARFSYYSGTDVSFGNLTMKFTTFAGYIQNYETGAFEWKTTDEQLQELYPYVMGKYTNGILDEDGKVSGTDIKTGVTGENAKIINEFLSWQLPPGGYEPDTRNFDNIQKGTLKLRFGVFYSLPSLVCTSAQFQFSKQMVKHWNGTKNLISPLFCDVTLTFQPSTKFSDDALMNFISGVTEKDTVTSVKIGLKNKLNTIKDKNKKLLGG